MIKQQHRGQREELLAQSEKDVGFYSQLDSIQIFTPVTWNSKSFPIHFGGSGKKERKKKKSNPWSEKMKYKPHCNVSSMFRRNC